MKAFLLVALQTIVKTLIGSLDYEQIKVLVMDAEREPVSGVEKRALVIQEAQKLGVAVSTALLNLAIESIVNHLRK